MTFLPKRIFPFFVVLFTVSVVGELGREWWVFDLFSHWRMLYITTGLLLLLIGFFTHRYKYLPVVVAVLCLHVFRVWPYFFVTHTPRVIAQKPSDSNEAQVLKVAFINTYWKIEKMDSIVSAIREMNPDFVFLEEIQPDQFTILQKELPQYIHNYQELAPAAFDMGYMSKLPVSNTETIFFLKGVPTIYATLELENGPVKIIGVHPPSPVSKTDTEERNELLSKLFLSLQSESVPVVVGGDFNVTQFSPVYEDMMTGSQLVDTMSISGLQNSWSKNISPAIRIPIDQIFISPEIQMINRTVGSENESDHLPIMVEVAL